jgi:hypothetical protein
MGHINLMLNESLFPLDIIPDLRVGAVLVTCVVGGKEK